MIKKQKIYGINLDDFSYPEQIRNKAGYAGTKEDLEDFAEMLEAYHWTDDKCSAVITAIRGCFSGKSHREMMEKYGDTFECVHPVEMCYEAAPMTLQRHCWQHKAANDAVYPMYAERVHVRRIIVKGYDFFYTALKGEVEGLRVCLQGTGWTKMRGSMSGHPEMVTYDSKEDIYEMRLFAVMDAIRPEEIDDVIRSWDAEEVNLDIICQDIIAEGKILMAHPKRHRA